MCSEPRVSLPVRFCRGGSNATDQSPWPAVHQCGWPAQLRRAPLFKGPMFGLTLCCRHPEILNDFTLALVICKWSPMEQWSLWKLWRQAGGQAQVHWPPRWQWGRTGSRQDPLWEQLACPPAVGPWGSWTRTKSSLTGTQAVNSVRKLRTRSTPGQRDKAFQGVRILQGV